MAVTLESSVASGRIKKIDLIAVFGQSVKQLRNVLTVIILCEDGICCIKSLHKSGFAGTGLSGDDDCLCALNAFNQKLGTAGNSYVFHPDEKIFIEIVQFLSIWINAVGFSDFVEKPLFCNPLSR